MSTVPMNGQSGIILPPGVESPVEPPSAAQAGNGNVEILSAVRVVSELLQREQFASRAGVTFGGKRDLYNALGYKRRISPKDYRDRYCRNAIAARIVEALPKATWRGTAKLVEDENNDQETKFERATRDFARKFQLWSVFLRADIIAGLGRYAVILIGARGELDRPLPKMGGADDVAFLSVFGEEDVTIDRLVEDPTDERFGLPLLYSFKRVAKQRQRVHWSRVVHVAEGVLDDEVYGMPRLERAWNLLDDLEKVTGAGAEAFWLRAHQGYAVEIDKETKLETDDVKKLKDEAEDFANQLRRTIGLKGGKMRALGSDVARFGDQVDAILTQIAGGAGIPKRVLTGSEMGELASSQDRRTWDERVIDRRVQFAGPHIVRTLVDRLIEHGALPEPKQYDVLWPQISELTDKERAEVGEQLARMNLHQAQAGQVAVATEDEIRERILGFPKLKDEERAAMERAFERTAGAVVPQSGDAETESNQSADPEDTANVAESA